MITAGVDIGAATAKIVILNEGAVLCQAVLPTGAYVDRVGEQLFEVSLKKAGLNRDDVAHVVSTGYGRTSVPFARKAVTEITCHAIGAHFLFPEARMVIDIGGQDSKAILMNGSGEVANFVMNDKCAAGTGRFLEVMSGVLEVPIEDMGAFSVRSRQPCSITSICTVFAESEVISLRAHKESVEDIIAGIHKSVGKRVANMARSMGCSNPIVFSGGVAKNCGVRKAIENEIRTEMIVPKEPQVVGALGAAILASELP